MQRCRSRPARISGPGDDLQDPAVLVEDLDELGRPGVGRSRAVALVHRGDGTVRSVAIGVYPGTFDPLTIAHLAVAETAVAHLGLERVDLAISRVALGKEHLDEHHGRPTGRRHRRAAATRPWLGVVVVETRLVADIADGYDAVGHGRRQVGPGGRPRRGTTATSPPGTPRWPASPGSRSRPGQDTTSRSELLLPVPAHLAEVSASAVRAGRHDWAAPEALPPTGQP